MNNNLIEIKYNRVNKFFDELREKYETEYQKNKRITEKVYTSLGNRVLKSVIALAISFLILSCLIFGIGNFTNYIG